MKYVLKLSRPGDLPDGRFATILSISSVEKGFTGCSRSITRSNSTQYAKKLLNHRLTSTLNIVSNTPINNNKNISNDTDITCRAKPSKKYEIKTILLFQFFPDIIQTKSQLHYVVCSWKKGSIYRVHSSNVRDNIIPPVTIECHSR
jgi:hypothetical protein